DPRRPLLPRVIQPKQQKQRPKHERPERQSLPKVLFHQILVTARFIALSALPTSRDRKGAMGALSLKPLPHGRGSLVEIRFSCPFFAFTPTRRDVRYRHCSIDSTHAQMKGL